MQGLWRYSRITCGVNGCGLLPRNDVKILYPGLSRKCFFIYRNCLTLS
ncbi:hypothetical protein GPEL0_01r4518 [Geoanaerobacter pelophilus]|uniref:Uncharacterized protein n=1 Tax=Geoanaerobacter pelophilus TaxID=60036 RepID=A0ABQ0MME8_9BACT|nr:hypothetical protein GPEL0_01r4518 [Geoanaerobacter pelophilus]